MPVYTSSIEVTADYPTIKPSLNLNFVKARALDPRVTLERASAATYIGRDGLVKYAGEDEPRFDHDPETLESLGLLIEESRTNLWNYSSNLTITDAPVYGNWNGSTRTGNVAVSPDGLTEGDRNTFATSTASTVKRFSATAGTVYTFSIYLKKDPTSIDTLLNQFGFIISWSNDGSTLTSYTFPDLVSGQNASDVLTDEWKRFSVSYTCPAGATSMEFGISNRGAGSPTLSQAYSVLCWGAQIEAGSFPTSYIPTSGSAVTRADDFGYITGANFSSWFNQSEGSLDVGYRLGYDNVGMRVCQISNQNANTVIDLVVGSGGGAGGYWFINTGGTTQFSSSGVVNSSQVGADRNFRSVLAYKENDCAAQQDKISTITTDTSVTLATDYDRLLFYQIANGGDQIQGHLKYIRYYPKRITNAQVTQLSQDENV